MKSKFFVIGVLLVCSCNMLSPEEQWRVKRENYVASHREELQEQLKQYFIKEMRKEPFYLWASKEKKAMWDLVFDVALDREEFHSSLEYQAANETQKKEIDVCLDKFDKTFGESENVYVDAILRGVIIKGMTVEQVKVVCPDNLHLMFKDSEGMSMYDTADRFYSSYSYYQSPYYTFTFDNGYLESWTKHGGW